MLIGPFDRIPPVDSLIVDDGNVIYSMEAWNEEDPMPVGVRLAGSSELIYFSEEMVSQLVAYYAEVKRHMGSVER